MTIERASRIDRSKITPPTVAEFGEAARRGRPLTGALLTEIRAAAKASKTTKQVMAAPLLVEKLRAQVSKLQNENSNLKLKLLLTK